MGQKFSKFAKGLPMGGGWGLKIMKICQRLELMVLWRKFSVFCFIGNCLLGQIPSYLECPELFHISKDFTDM